MPTYQYVCTQCGHAFEQVQSFSDDSLTSCPQCEGALRKVFSAVGVVFKGSGFYRTDSRDGASKKPAAANSAETGSAATAAASSDSSAGTSGNSTSDSGASATPAAASSSPAPSAAKPSTPSSD